MRDVNVYGEPKQSGLEQVKENQTIKFLRVKVWRQQQGHRQRGKPENKDDVGNPGEVGKLGVPMNERVHDLAREEQAKGHGRQPPETVRKGSCVGVTGSDDTRHNAEEVESQLDRFRDSEGPRRRRMRGNDGRMNKKQKNCEE